MSHRIGLSLVLSAALVTGCAGQSADAGPSNAAVTVTNCGQQLIFPRPPERVVTVEQSATETLLALGLGDRMVGSAYLVTKVAPQYQAAYEKVPVLNPKTLTGEQLRAATPDFVVTSFASNYTKDLLGTREELRDLGLPAYVSLVDCPKDEPGLTPFERLFKDYETFGRIFGVQDRAAALIAEQREILKKAEGAAAGKPSIVWLYSTFKGQPYVAGHNGMPSDMSRILGAPNAFDDVNEEWPEVSWEEIAKRDPSVIVVGDLAERGAPGDRADERIVEMKAHPVVSQLKAVRENRFIVVPGVELDPTVRTPNTLRLVTEGLKNFGHVS